MVTIVPIVMLGVHGKDVRKLTCMFYDMYVEM